MEAQNCFLNKSKPSTWAHRKCIRMINIKRQKAYKMHAFQVYGQAISSKYQKIIIKVQPFQAQAILS